MLPLLSEDVGLESPICPWMCLFTYFVSGGLVNVHRQQSHLKYLVSTTATQGASPSSVFLCFESWKSLGVPLTFCILSTFHSPSVIVWSDRNRKNAPELRSGADTYCLISLLHSFPSTLDPYLHLVTFPIFTPTLENELMKKANIVVLALVGKPPSCSSLGDTAFCPVKSFCYISTKLGKLLSCSNLLKYFLKIIMSLWHLTWRWIHEEISWRKQCL